MLRAPDLEAVLGLLVDEQREAIWVLGRRTVDLHDLTRPGGMLQLRQPLPGGSRPNSLSRDELGGLRVADADGATVATSDMTGRCWH